MIILQKTPPPLPTQWTFSGQPLATKDQRIRAGLIDHFIDSSLWLWLFILVAWCALHLESSMDARSFLVLLATNFPISIGIIGVLIVFDFLFCVSHGQSIGQLINGIYKMGYPASSHRNRVVGFSGLKIWFHSLISRCLGMPLLSICVLIWLILDPIITPIQLQSFSIIEPEGAYRLMVFLLEIIGWVLLVFGLFLPFGIGFIRGSLPTWYDHLLGVRIVEKPHKSHS